jgi:predicted RNA-binding Zn-ribbon protein involved in translation (DUF1610 family)
MSTLFNTGRNGEFQIYHLLCNVENDECKFLFNCYLPKSNGETTEIDVLMINTNGIYVFESKNYSGWIFGSETSKQWTQTLPQGKGRSHKEHFFNPIMQNKVHIKWLRNLLGDEVSIYSIIVFSNRCTLKNLNIISKDVHVINRHKIYQSIEEIGFSQSRKLTVHEINEIYNILYPYSQVSEELKQKHIHNLVNDHKTLQLTYEPASVCSINNQNESVTQKCPRCGAQLVIRTVKKGMNSGQQFYGCSCYPQCRYTKVIT